MTSAFDVLTGLIAQLPESLKPVVTHIGVMMKQQSGALVTHVGDNNNTYSDFTRVTGQLTDRTGVIEGSVVAINATLVQISQKLDGMDTALAAAATLEHSPVVNDIRDEIAGIKGMLASTDEALKKEMR